MKYIAISGTLKHSVVATKKGVTALGCIAEHGEVFKRRLVFSAYDDLTEFTSECLREIADYMDAQDNTKVAAQRRAVVPAALRFGQRLANNRRVVPTPRPASDNTSKAATARKPKTKRPRGSSR